METTLYCPLPQGSNPLSRGDAEGRGVWLLTSLVNTI